MSDLIAFLARFYRFFLFAFLQVLSLYMVLNYNNFQSATFYQLSYETSGRVYRLYDDVNLYFHLRQANDSLMAENARLRAMQSYSKYVDTAKKQNITDTVYKQKYTYLPANVINNSTGNADNYLTLDIGSNKGVSHPLGVITSSGIVGITRDVSPNFTSVLSILHKEFSLSCRIVETGAIGRVSWDGKNAKFVTLEIDATAKIKDGEHYHVVTSPYTSLFPEGIAVGEFNHFTAGTDNKYYIQVRLSTDLSSVRQVYIVNNLMKEEQKKVEQTQKDK